MLQTTFPPKVQSNKGRLVDTRHVDTLISTYKKNRWLDNSQKIGKPDSLSTWYGLSELQDFLDLAKENQADGIKIYFGEYPADYPVTPEFQNRQTVVLVATKKSKNEYGVVNKEIYSNRTGKPEILAFNSGDICPPWCGNGLPPYTDSILGIDISPLGLSLTDTKNGISFL